MFLYEDSFFGQNPYDEQVTSLLDGGLITFDEARDLIVKRALFEEEPS